VKTATYNVRGMHCASCAGIIEKTFRKTAGVQSAEVNYGTETAKISFDELRVDENRLSKAIEPFGYSLVASGPSAEEMWMLADEYHKGTSISLERSTAKGNWSHAEHLGLNQPPLRQGYEGQAKEEKLAELAEMKWKVISAIPLTIISIFVMGWDALAELSYVAPQSSLVSEFFHHLLPLFATYVLFVVGKPYLLGFARFLRYGKANMDTLIGIGTSVAYLYSFILTAFEEPLRAFVNVDQTYYDVTIVVITFIALGKYAEAKSKLRTGEAIEKLLNLQAKTGLVLRDGKEVEVPIADIRHGDTVIVKPGARIPVDGILTDGESFIDEALVTGEPLPVRKKSGDTVVAGMINTTGSFTFRTTKIGSETFLAHIIKMVTEAQGSKAPIQALVDKISSVFVPIVLVLSFVTLGLWLIIGTEYLGFAKALSLGLTSFVGILVMACPCALGLATPTAIIVGVGKGAREGILIKDAATLQKLHTVNTVVVDKTGTLTRGKPELAEIKTLSDNSERDLVGILASLESKSEHPIAHAILEYAKEKGISLLPVDKFETVKGKGLHGVVGGVEYFAGNAKLASDLSLTVDHASVEKETTQGKTPILLMTRKETLGVCMVYDAIKQETTEAVRGLRKLGIHMIMLTGDDKNTAEAIAKEAGIDTVLAEVLPDIKLQKILELQQSGKIVAMAGDGVNDAPALAQADVGIAMATGTDVAIETAGITLLRGDISKLVKAVRLSRLTMRGVKQNLFWSFIYNLVGIPIAAGALYPVFGLLLSPIFAGMAMAFSSVSVVLNSLRFKNVKL